MMRDSDRDEMRQQPIFDGVATPHVDAMLKAAYLQRFPPMVELAHEGSPADFLHIIVEGQVEVFAGYRNRETTISIQGPGQALIVAAVILDRVHLQSARALTATRILLLPGEAVRNAYAEDIVFCRRMGEQMALGYRSVVKELKNQKLRSSLERVANWLIAFDAASGETGRFTLPFDKKILASRLGIVPEVLSRAFASLQAYGLRVDGPWITIGDRDALLSLAHPEPMIDDPEA